MENNENKLNATTSEEYDSWTIIGEAARNTLLTAAATAEPPTKEEEDKGKQMGNGDDEKKGGEQNNASEMNVCQENEKRVNNEKPSDVEIVANQQEEKLTKDDEEEASHDLNEEDEDDGESSDGISVISESDGSTGVAELKGKRVKLHENLNLKAKFYEPLTPPYSPEEEKDEYQLMRRDSDAQRLVQSSQTDTSNHGVTHKSWITFGIIAIALGGILLGNSMRLQSHVTEFNVEHEKRISELELENNILKNEMNRLKQTVNVKDEIIIQQAEFIAPPSHPAPQRKPSKEDALKRKLVWAGDDDDPLFIPDKNFNLPEFCYNPNAPTDELYTDEQREAYCQAKKIKIDGKMKREQFKKQKKVHLPPPQAEEKIRDPDFAIAPDLMNNYQEKIEAIKNETDVIVEAISSFIGATSGESLNFDADDERSVDEIRVQEEIEEKTMNLEAIRKPGYDEERRKHYKDYKKENKEYNKDNRGDYENKKREGSGREYNKEKRTEQNQEESGKENYKEKRREDRDYVKREEGSGEKNYKEKRREDHDHRKQQNYKDKREYYDKKDGSGEYVKEYEHKDERREDYDRKKNANKYDKKYNKIHDEKHYKKDDDNDKEWNEKRMKGREEYRKDGDFKKKDGEWNEKRYNGREEYRQKKNDDEDRDKNWYLNRGNQRDRSRNRRR